MSINLNVLIVILGVAIVTYIARALPILVLANKELPSDLKIWMKYIPPAIFAALILPDICNFNGDLSFVNPKFFSSIIVFLVSYKTKSLALSIIFGVISISLLL